MKLKKQKSQNNPYQHKQINWIEKEGKEQVKKTVEKEDSEYIQNEEQNDESLWNRVKDVKNDQFYIYCYSSR